jgi:DNA repair protein RAD5
MQRKGNAVLNVIYRLRRAVLHPSLIASKDSEVNKIDRNGEIDVDDLIARYMNEGGDLTVAPSFAQHNIAALKGSAEQECSICLEPMDPPVLAPRCMHSTFVLFDSLSYILTLA